MYDEGADAAGPAPVLGGGMVRNINFEGLIPLVILVLVGILSLNYFNVVDIPYLPKGGTNIQVLVIGEPSLGQRVILDQSNYYLTYRVRDADTFYVNASEELSQYDIVILDQSQLSDKSVNTVLAQAIQNYVTKGGKLIVVQNSGIYMNVGLGGAVATDVVGWKANFGNIMPMECAPGTNNVPTCAESQATTVVGRIIRQNFNHPIMEGIPQSPPEGAMPYTLTTFPVQANQGGKTIAFIKGEGVPKTYPAIIEKKAFPLGTVVYFNYDPGLTPGIFNNTLEYLR
jgi:hypothetical protein